MELDDNVVKFSDNLYVLSFDYKEFDFNTVVDYLKYLNESLSPAQVIGLPVGMNLSYLHPHSIAEMKEFVRNIFQSYGEDGVRLNSAITNEFGDDV